MKKKKLLTLPALLLAAALYFFLPSEPAQSGTEPVAPQSSDIQLINEQDVPKENSTQESEISAPADPAVPDEDGSYTTKEDVALYLHTYGHLPPNFVTKKEAEQAGWQGGSLEKYLPGKCIGGSYFGNYEGTLPAAKGRSWHECDINTLGKKSRGSERLVYSNDGLIYYTNDHYETFELLYD